MGAQNLRKNNKECFRLIYNDDDDDNKWVKLAFACSYSTKTVTSVKPDNIAIQFHHRRHSLPSVNNLKPGSSENHIRTSSSEPAVSIYSIINLEVALLLRQSLIDWLIIRCILWLQLALHNCQQMLFHWLSVRDVNETRETRDSEKFLGIEKCFSRLR